MPVKFHNVPEASAEGKVTNAIIEHGMGRLVFHRINDSNIIQVALTPNIERELKVLTFMLTVDEFKEVMDNLDLEEEDLNWA